MKSCGCGSRERIKTVAVTAKNGGNECVGRNRNKESCTKGACPGIINKAYGRYVFVYF